MSETGTVKWFNARRGYGFIIDDLTGDEVFVHYSGIVSDGFKALNDGEKVSYDVEKTEKGKQAINVTKTE